MPKERAMPCFAVFALKRADWTEAIVGLARTEEGARRLGQRVAASWQTRFVRCRVSPMHLTASQMRTICREWGRVDALEGVSLRPTKFPQPYDAASTGVVIGRVWRKQARPATRPRRKHGETDMRSRR
jgi:hypothetical protein